jgi:putative oxidoreductase
MKNLDHDLLGGEQPVLQRYFRKVMDSPFIKLLTKWGTWREVFVFLVIWLYIVLYGYTAIDKLWNVGTFIDAINVQVFPKVLTPYIAWGIPVIELILFSLLIIPKTQHLGLYLATGLMLVFTIYVGWGAVQDVGDRPCGCAGIFSTLKWHEHFQLNSAFLLGGLGALACVVWKEKIRRIKNE